MHFSISVEETQNQTNKILLWQGFYSWLCLSASVLFVSVFCSTAEILCNSPCLACEWLVYIFPETHVFDPHTFYKQQANQLPSLFTLKFVSFYPLGSTLNATQHNRTLYLVQTTKPVVTQEQNLVVLIHIGLPVVSAQRAVHWRECLYSSEWCTEWFRASSGGTRGEGDYESRHLETWGK